MRSPAICSRIIFQSPFSLRGIPTKQPAGSYSIETRDRHRWRFPFSWERKTRTTIRVHAKYGLEGSLHEYDLDPRDIFEALERDKLCAVA